MSKDTDNYFLIKKPKFVRFSLLPKVHRRQHDVFGRPLISDCYYCIEKVCSFLDRYFQPLTQNVKSFVKDTNQIKKARQNTARNDFMYY